MLLLNLRHILYGLSLNAVFPAKTRPRRPALAYFLTGKSFGLTIRDYRQGRGTPGFLFGASLSVFACYVTATLAGTLGRTAIPDPDRLGLDFVFPLSFLALLLPLLRKRLDLLVAAIAGLIALGLSRFVSDGVTILLATITAAATGAVVSTKGRVQR